MNTADDNNFNEIVDNTLNSNEILDYNKDDDDDDGDNGHNDGSSNTNKAISVRATLAGE